MESILLKSQLKIENIPLNFKRYLFNNINNSNQLIAILGARGVGKTTLLLQYAKEQNQIPLYVALDDLFFSENTLYSLAENFQKIGGKLLLLDEVHKYPNWSRELKLIYDDFTHLKVIFTSSSILDIYKGESDLSRRAVSYNLKSLSFREFLMFYKGIELPTYTLDEIVKNHAEISLQLIKEFKPFKYFSEYLKVGAYPYYQNNEQEYYQQLLNTINLILDVDLQSITNIDYNNIAKFKRLLYVIATNVPFIPNIKKLSERIGVNRNVLVQALQLLEKAELIHTLYKKNKSVSVLNKPDKIWLRNTNLNYAISAENVNTGNVRETFFIQHLSLFHHLSLVDKGDFLVDSIHTFEIGGKGKTQKQIKTVPNSYLVKYDEETGVLNNIPLWLFGLIY
jgi:predicted AAA+ superfamily ATPase